MQYILQKSVRKTLTLTVKNWELVVKAPLQISREKIDQFVKKHTKWIDKRMNQQENSLINPKLIPQYKQQARKIITQKVEFFAHKYGFCYNTIKITSAKTRWGSCTSKWNLNFSYRLVLTPDDVIDYVVVHELCHLRQMNHSVKFWKEVETILPDYKTQNTRLRRNGYKFSC